MVESRLAAVGLSVSNWDSLPIFDDREIKTRRWGPGDGVDGVDLGL